MIYRSVLAQLHHRKYGGLARDAAPAIVGWLRAAGIRRGPVVDLGCGSGILAARLTAAGYEVIGVDLSAAMLRIAVEVAPRARFVRARAEDVVLPRCAAIVATGEAITYLSGTRTAAASLRHHVRRAARALPAGGLFVFDAIASAGEPMRYRSCQVDRHSAVLVDVREDTRRHVVERAMTVFAKDERDGWCRDDERHRVGVYERAAVLELLRAHGFTARVAARYGRIPLLPRRVVFVARRAAGRRSHRMA